jgi:hypothetical protein
MSALEFSQPNATIAKALVKASAGMDGVRKNAINPAFRSKYADLASVAEAVQPALQAAGIAVVQGASASYDDSGVLVTIETMLLHESGEWVRNTLTLRPTKHDPQGVGSAITYGRRYGLQSLCGVAPEDDDANKASEPVEKPKATRATSSTPPADIQSGRMSALVAAANNVGIVDVRAWLAQQVTGCSDLADPKLKRALTAAQCGEAMDKLKIMAEERAQASGAA